MHRSYDVIVAGGGHAGVEAAWISAKMGGKVLLVTQTVDQLAQMSCNPAIGGLAKSHLVKEIDMLGGLMGIAADRTGIQFKTLNSSKGPAVWALRVQSDKRKYSEFVRSRLEKKKNLNIIQDEVVDLIIENGELKAVKTAINGLIHTKTAIICSGTFLKAVIHIGKKQIPSGRLGEPSADSLSKKLRDHGFETGRLKTGTPPRIAGYSIDFTGLEIHGSDEHIIPFSFRHKKTYLKQLPCYITYTNEKTHSLIDANLDKTALFSGQIKGTGPRYCPSIEDKVNRFRDKISHRLFLEPEGLYTNEYYVNGFSSSLPVEIQKKALRTVRGMENAHFVRPAYAIEYDYFPAYQIKMSLETRNISGLFFAGQINGTSGYEEAAAQGLMAGINSILKIRGEEPFILKRNEAYTGVLIDDLITKDIREPYRMFTSLAEYRLELRHDNADSRLLKYAEKYKLLTGKEIKYLNDRLDNIAKLPEIFSSLKIKMKKLNEFYEANSIGQSSEGTDIYRLLKRPDTNINMMLNSGLLDKIKDKFSYYELKQAETLIKYEGYIKRQNEMIGRFEKNEKIKLPQEIDYSQFKGLKKEAVEKLNRIKPVSVGQAGRIAGISPADISVILINLKTKGLI
ncbi:MAG: tRNA uridine-5-carboxymethylaminomethyl(34) synthesis enzyme MnmG [Candidatus Delongbacteria bacterium]|jgi:tRNA uridine 5-carboxymethylaminomethyl modification enzyme|nr:tRNA uridine-5-carboxymethylaminomethyl(34) synthesis enzyme MnmG [Candidatus Delongbacteria bacterium]